MRSLGSVTLLGLSLALHAGCTFDRGGVAATGVCGNGVIECGEACDDGNTLAGDGCDNQCRAESTATCGDGVVEGAEVCESGAVGSTCVDEGFTGGTLLCAAGCLSFDTSACTRTDGEPCSANSQCDGGTCYDEPDDGWPGGFCTRCCGFLGAQCLDGFTCVDLGDTSRCYRRCDSSAQCRAGYFCRLDPFEKLELVCRPHCESDSHCANGGICNLWSGLCDGAADPVEADNGQPCGDFLAPCKGACWGEPQGGYCLSTCSLTSGFCPGDGVCTDFDEPGDLGYCLDGCTSGSDCTRSGYTCQTNPWVGGDVCWQQ